MNPRAQRRTTSSSVDGPPPASGTAVREWIGIEDPDDDRTWLFDLNFLVSPWHCLYGSGCLGVLTGPAPERAEGCCSYGAHFADEDDLARVEAAARHLGPSQWQHRAAGLRRGIARQRAGEAMTRIVDGACIFLNRPDFAGGPGCALHRAALEEGVLPRLTKPDVCWQLPLRREDHVEMSGHVTTTIGAWHRRHWGPAGHEFHWWCTEGSDAFSGDRLVYLTLADELTALTSEPVYRMLCDYLGSNRPAPRPKNRPAVPVARPSARSSPPRSSSPGALSR